MSSDFFKKLQPLFEAEVSNEQHTTTLRESANHQENVAKEAEKKPANVKETATEFFRKYSSIISEAESDTNNTVKESYGDDDDEDPDVKKAMAVKGKDGRKQGDVEQKTKWSFDKKFDAADKKAEDKAAKKVAKEKVDEGMWDSVKSGAAKLGNKMNSVAGKVANAVGIEPAEMGAKFDSGVAKLKNVKATITNNPNDRKSAKAASFKAADSRGFVSGRDDSRVSKHRGDAISHDYAESVDDELEEDVSTSSNYQDERDRLDGYYEQPEPAGQRHSSYDDDELNDYINKPKNEATESTAKRKIRRASLEIDGVDRRDAPDYSDAYFSYGEYTDGTPLSDNELDALTDKHRDIVNELAHDMDSGSGDLEESTSARRWVKNK